MKMITSEIVTTIMILSLSIGGAKDLVSPVAMLLSVDSISHSYDLKCLSQM